MCFETEFILKHDQNIAYYTVEGAEESIEWSMGGDECTENDTLTKSRITRLRTVYVCSLLYIVPRGRSQNAFTFDRKTEYVLRQYPQ